MTKVAIMQPYFFPYLGYFSLLKNTDRFILLDEVQFIRHGWIERNRILKQTGGWLYIKVPLIKHSRQTPIKDIRIDNNQNWRQSIASQLETYKKIAPHYSQISQLVTKTIASDYDNIVSLDKAALEAVLKYLGLNKKIEIFSKMKLRIETPRQADDWALNICMALGGVSEYWNPPGGQGLFNKSKYIRAGIDLKFLKPNLEEYNQRRQEFEPGLSIIDVLMFNEPRIVNEMLDKYEIT
jgi:hypothetical protein